MIDKIPTGTALTPTLTLTLSLTRTRTLTVTVTRGRRGVRGGQGNWARCARDKLTDMHEMLRGGSPAGKYNVSALY